MEVDLVEEDKQVIYEEQVGFEEQNGPEEQVVAGDEPGPSLCVLILVFKNSIGTAHEVITNNL